MLIEARVLSGNDGVLEIGGDLIERKELVMLAIRCAVDQGLEAAFDVDGGRRRVDPAESYKGHRSQQPESCHGDGDPAEREEKKSPGEEMLFAEKRRAKHRCRYGRDFGHA
jgi:hypothetical protein